MIARVAPFVLAGLAVALPPAFVRGQDFPGPPLPGPPLQGPLIPGPPLAGPPLLCMEQLTHMNWCQLEQIYRGAKAGPIPDGFYRGQVIYGPDKKFPHLSETLAKCWWKGKTFYACEGRLVNHWLIGKAGRADVFYGPSRFDGCPSVIMDYSTGHLPSWRDVRDEIREIAPGLYLGALFLHSKPCAPPEMFFVIQCGKH